MSWGWVVSNPALLRPELSGPGMISPTKHQKTLNSSVNWKYFSGCPTNNDHFVLKNHNDKKILLGQALVN